MVVINTEKYIFTRQWDEVSIRTLTSWITLTSWVGILQILYLAFHLYRI